MRTLIFFIAVSLAHAADSRCTLEKRDPVNHVFTSQSALDVDLISGSLQVVADQGSNIRLTGERVVCADTQEDLNRGDREVTLENTDANGAARVYANGPFRQHDGSGDRHYNVAYNLIIHIPKSTTTHLRTVNGSMQLQDLAAPFNVHAVNGAVTMTGLDAAGDVDTVNGKINAVFTGNPKADASFKTVNGSLTVELQPGVNALLSVKTLNGNAWTDFDTTPQPATRRSQLRPRAAQTLQVGSGGPHLRFETVNGNIQIAKKGR